MTQDDVAETLERLGRPIPVASIGRIESGLRAVEVDDLMALSAALNVSPLGLLLPRARTAQEVVEATGLRTPAQMLWLWAAGSTSVEERELPAHGEPWHYNRNDVTDLALPRWLELVGSILRPRDDMTVDESQPRHFPFTRVDQADG